MNKINSLQTRTKQDRKFANASPSHSRLPGALMVAGGLLLILGAPTLVWLFRGMLADLGPRVLISLWYGAGGLILLYFAAGLPLGAILLAAGGARLFPASERAGRVLLPLLGIQLVYFIYHAIRLSGSGRAGVQVWNLNANGRWTCSWGPACVSSPPHGKPAVSPGNPASPSTRNWYKNSPTNLLSRVRC